jgi:hypothetical protein
VAGIPCRREAGDETGFVGPIDSMLDDGMRLATAHGVEMTDLGRLKVLSPYLSKARPAPLVLALLIAESLSAHAASIKYEIFGCREEMSAKKRIEQQGHKGPSPASAKTAEPCSDLPKGMTVTIEQTDGQFLCVRPWGALQCFWTQSAAIDQNKDPLPSAPKPLWGKAHFNGFKPSFTTQF